VGDIALRLPKPVHRPEDLDYLARKGKFRPPTAAYAIYVEKMFRIAATALMVQHHPFDHDSARDERACAKCRFLKRSRALLKLEPPRAPAAKERP